MFQLFGSVRNKKRKLNTNGIGLGLVISKLIVNQFFGEISFTSKYKKGTTFTYTFELQNITEQHILEEREFKQVEKSNNIINKKKVLKNMTSIIS